MEKKVHTLEDQPPMKSLVVVFSYHHKNTEKIANVCATVLDSQVITPQQVNPEKLAEYSLIGFGSGIYSDKHHESILDLADKLPQACNKKVFIFSTSGIPEAISGRKYIEEYSAKSHSPLREKLKSKGYEVIGEFICAGFNTNAFLKWFGGLNKGRPNADDLRHAEKFARNLKEKARGKG